uniref:C2H2-type domain-containing protein n=1 Tax=Steinernema glaseri TaxID=37863 RepID=A0A1I8AIJ7_9BILA
MVFHGKEQQHLQYIAYDDDEYFRCTFPGCTRMFKLRSSLNRHIDVDHATRPVRKQCPQCRNCSYKYGCDLLKHFREFHGWAGTEKGGVCSENCRLGVYDVPVQPEH